MAFPAATAEQKSHKFKNIQTELLNSDQESRTPSPALAVQMASGYFTVVKIPTKPLEQVRRPRRFEYCSLFPAVCLHYESHQLYSGFCTF